MMSHSGRDFRTPLTGRVRMDRVYDGTGNCEASRAAEGRSYAANGGRRPKTEKPGTRPRRLLLDEAVARVAVVVDVVLLLQLLNVINGPSCMRAGDTFSALKSLTPFFATEAIASMQSISSRQLSRLIRLCSARSCSRAARRFSRRTGTSTRSILRGGVARFRRCPKLRW